MKGILYLVIIFASISWIVTAIAGNGPEQHRKSITIPNFDQKAWLDDSLGCNNNRNRLLDTLGKYESEIIGRSMQDVRTLLGKPNFEHPISLWYYYGIGDQCLKTDLCPEEFDKELIWYTFRNDSCIEVRMIMH